MHNELPRVIEDETFISKSLLVHITFGVSMQYTKGDMDDTLMFNQPWSFNIDS